MESLPASLLAAAILLLAGPQRLGEPESKRIMTNVELCLDVSGSMTATFGDGTQYDAAMKALEEFVHYRKGDSFGLTFFGSNVLHWCPLTLDVSAITCSTPFMRPENIPHWFGGTEIGKAVVSCQKILRAREQGERMIVLITDGMSADLYGGRAEELAASLRNDAITLYAVMIGDLQTPDEIVNLARITGGEVFQAGDPDALRFVFKRIDEMKKTEMEKVIAETKDYFEPICWAGVGLLGLLGLAAFGLRYTPW
jgi:Ca-activated chloride channel family protein